MFWDQKIDAMEATDFLTTLDDLAEHQPFIGLTLVMMDERIANPTAFIGFLRFLTVVWRCLESIDARVRTQPLRLEDFKRHFTTRAKMWIYITGETEGPAIDAVLNPHVRDHRQWNLLGYIWGGVLTENDLFPVDMGVRYQIVTWLFALVDTFDEQLE